MQHLQYRLSVVALALALGACAGSDDSGGAHDAPGPASAAAAGADGVMGEPEALRFAQPSPISIATGDTLSLELQAEPALAYPIRFALVEEGRDAALSAGTSVMEDGVAVVELTASTSPTEFVVRATVGEVSVDLEVVVTGSPSSGLVVEPEYAGQRTTSEWRAVAILDTTCLELGNSPVGDGDANASTPDGEPLTLTHLPPERPMAVWVESDRAVSGCSDVSALAEGEERSIRVAVDDRPARLEGTTLELSFGVDFTFNAWRDGVRTSLPFALESLRGDHSSDSEALLDAMYDARVATDSGSADAFASARATRDWDESIATVVGEAAIRDIIEGWFEAAAEHATGSGMFEGTLAIAEEGASIDLESLGTFSQEKVSSESRDPATVAITSRDALSLGASFHWFPSQLLAAMAEVEALREAPQATSGVDALARRLSCLDVADSLTPVGSSDLVAGCDLACGVEWCEQGLRRLWQSMVNDSADRSAPASLALSATATFTVDEAARPKRLQGAWVGTLSTEETTVSLRGDLSGAR